jgi:hypothetical protein
MDADQIPGRPQKCTTRHKDLGTDSPILSGPAPSRLDDTPGNRGPIRCRFIPFAGATGRALTTASGDQALTSTYLVAG